MFSLHRQRLRLRRPNSPRGDGPTAGSHQSTSVSSVFKIRKPWQSFRHVNPAGSEFDNRLALTFDLLNSGSTRHAERLPYTVCLRRLVLIARAVFLLERGHTDRHTYRHTDTHTVTYASDHSALWPGYRGRQ